MSVKYKRAAALQYQQGVDSTPVLSLMVEQADASKAVSLARRFHVPIIERPELVQALSVFEIDSGIPEDLFEAVAVILAEIENRLGK